MRLIIPLTVVALAGLATASLGTSHGTSVGFRGLVSGIRGGSGQSGGYASHGQSYRSGNGPLGLFYSFLDPYLGHKEFTWRDAHYQCQHRGMRLVSLDNYHKDHVVSQLIYRYGVKWIWTSGYKSGYRFYWGNGYPVGQYYRNWSPTGRHGYPQPDNAEGNEYCVAMLNNYYHDGIVWHDIACSHRKSFVCEPYYYDRVYQ